MVNLHPRQHPTRQPGPVVVPARCALAGLAVLALAAGVAVYTWARPALAGSAQLAWLGPLPSALHSLAFTLALGLVLARSRAQMLAVASGWTVLNAVVEACQHPLLHSRLPALWARHWAGQFDPLDLLATALAAAVAAAAVSATLPAPLSAGRDVQSAAAPVRRR